MSNISSSDEYEVMVFIVRVHIPMACHELNEVVWSGFGVMLKHAYSRQGQAGTKDAAGYRRHRSAPRRAGHEAHPGRGRSTPPESMRAMA